VARRAIDADSRGKHSKRMIDQNAARSAAGNTTGVTDDSAVAGGAIPERMVPGVADDALYQEHMQRYVYAATLAAGLDVLDIACGSGYGSKVLADAGAARSVTGIDLSETAIQHARQHFAAPNLRFAAGNAQALPELASGSFDLIVSFETIEHLPDVEQYLSQMHRVLRPGGTFLCSTPDGRLCSLLSRFRGGRPRNPHHIREYTLDQFTEVLRKRFEVREVLGQQYVGPILALWPMQIVLRGSALVVRGPLGRVVARAYKYGTDFSVRSRPTPRSVARYWLARCEVAR